MKETIASTWIYQLVIAFVLIFVSFLILSLTYSKTFKTKNELLNIIEKYEGVNSNSIEIINNYLTYNSYKTKNNCPTTGGQWLGAANIKKGSKLEKVVEGKKYYYCVNKKVTNKAESKGYSSKMYYQVKIFFKFNLPIIGDISTFTVDGTTNNIFLNKDVFDDIYRQTTKGV